LWKNNRLGELISPCLSYGVGRSYDLKCYVKLGLKDVKRDGEKKFVYSLMLYGDPWVDLDDLALPLVLWDEDFHWHLGMREVYLSDVCGEKFLFFSIG
jgi:hypothetical protein